VKFIPYGHQDINEDDIAAVSRVLRSDFLTQGPAIEEFEKAVCRESGSAFAVACNNGTAALHLAAIAADIQPGDTVIVSAVTFVASANCARFNGARVLFADIDSDTLTMSPIACRKLLVDANAAGRPVKAVITVDLAGHPCDMQAFASLKREFNFVWIQDACHAIGAAWEDVHGIRWKVGEWPEVDLTVYSFHPVKHITTGEGGMITTHSAEMADKMRLYRTHGITRKPEEFVLTQESYDTDGSVNPWYYEMQQLGFNYRLTDMQAALGTSQLSRLAAGIIRRQKIVATYQIKLGSNPNVRFPGVADGVSHAYHLAVVLIDFDALKKSRAQVMNRLKQNGIGTQVHYMPVPMMPYYRDTADIAAVPAAVAYYRQALSLPCFPQMTDEDIDRVCEELKGALR